MTDNQAYGQTDRKSNQPTVNRKVQFLVFFLYQYLTHLKVLIDLPPLFERFTTHFINNKLKNQCR